MTHTDILAAAMNLPPLGQQLMPIPGGAYCAITGVALEAGYRVMDIAPPTVSDYADVFNGNLHGWLSVSAAQMFAAKTPIGGSGSRANQLASPEWNFGSRVAFADGTQYHVLIAHDQAEKQGRPYWSRLARELWPEREGQQCVMILATDVKKRTWHRARAGFLGARTPVYIHAPEFDFSGLQYCDWPRLLACLDTIETAYALGFSKDSIRASLLADYKRTAAYGFPETRALDIALNDIRMATEFLPALIMAQKPQSTTP